jgi:hypothetical protein
MTKTIEKKEWKNFFDAVSTDFASWETLVQVISNDVGAQTISEGLPFGGITFEDKEGNATIELLLGVGTENHQSHVVADPSTVAFEPDNSGIGGVLDIEDSIGTKTLVRFVQPLPELVEFTETTVFAVS